jgi:PAS domain S-box-containing protein
MSHPTAEVLLALYNDPRIIVITVKEGGVITSANLGAEHYFKYPESQMVGRTYMELSMPDEDLEADNVLYKELMAGKLGRDWYEIIKTYRPKKGVPFTGHLRVTKLNEQVLKGVNEVLSVVLPTEGESMALMTIQPKEEATRIVIPLEFFKRHKTLTAVGVLMLMGGGVQGIADFIQLVLSYLGHLLPEPPPTS